MATLADLKTRKDRLEKQRHSGVARVTFNGRTVEYRGDTEITKAIGALDEEIKKLEGTKIVRQIRPIASKGL